MQTVVCEPNNIWTAQRIANNLDEFARLIYIEARKYKVDNFKRTVIDVPGYRLTVSGSFLSYGFGTPNIFSLIVTARWRNDGDSTDQEVTLNFEKAFYGKIWR